MQKELFYFKDSGDFINKFKISHYIISGGAILVTAEIVDLYPSIPNKAGFRAPKEALDNRESKTVLTKNLVKMTKFLLKNNYAELSGKVNQQV